MSQGSCEVVDGIEMSKTWLLLCGTHTAVRGRKLGASFLTSLRKVYIKIVLGLV